MSSAEDSLMRKRKWPPPHCIHPRCELGRRVIKLLEQEGRITHTVDGQLTGKAVLAIPDLNIAQRLNGTIYVSAFGLREDSVSSTGILTITHDDQVSSGSNKSVNWALEGLRKYMLLQDIADA